MWYFSLIMREILDIVVMVKMLLIFTVMVMAAPHRHLNIETETNLEYQEYQVNTEKPHLCADSEHLSFVIEPDLRGNIIKHIFSPPYSLLSISVPLLFPSDKWYWTYISITVIQPRPLSLVESFICQSVATPPLLCHKEPARRIQSPLLGGFLLAPRWFFMA